MVRGAHPTRKLRQTNVFITMGILTAEQDNLSKMIVGKSFTPGLGQTAAWLLSSLLGLCLGGVFFYAGVVKHFHPYEFAEAVLAYRLLPQTLVGLTAATLPWVELFTGFLLVLGYLAEMVGRLALALGFSSGAALVGGIKRRSCLLILGFMSGVFLIIILITMARGLKIDCGCGLFSDRQVGPAALLEDVAFLALAAGLYWWDLRIGGGGQGSETPASSPNPPPPTP